MRPLIGALGVSAAVLALIPVRGGAAEAEQAGQILTATGVKGGLVVHVGCGDGKLTAALHANDSYLVQGLDSDAQNVEAARQHIQARKLYGPVSVQQWKGPQLPFIDNAVNLVVAGDAGSVSMDEILRVLAPEGVAWIDGKKTVKPRPDDIDEWTHYLHDASNNAVAHDNVIDPLRRLQWIAAPLYSRQHDHMSGASAMVSAGGRLFYIFEEAPRASVLIPPQWYLYARDAFSGTLLWKRPIQKWHEHLWPLKSGPQLLTRRLVAMGDRVYVTMDIDAPLSVLDAATGRTIRSYEDTKATEEILCDSGVLFLSVAGKGQPLRSDPDRKYEGLADIKADVTNPLWTEAPRTVMAVEADSGKMLWKHATTVVSMSLTADSRRVLFHDGVGIQCLDRRTGKPLWTSEPLAKLEGMRSSGGVTLVSSGDVILYSGQVAETKSPRALNTMSALSAEDGKLLWKAEHPPCGHRGTPDDILVLNNVVWSGAVAQGSDSGVMTGRDLHTGKVLKEFPPDVDTHWFHHRCYRAKATDKYLLYSRTGIEFIDVEKSHWTTHHWVRGGCLYGIMPANGLVYNPPHPCACYIEAKLFGFNALAPALKTPPPPTPEQERLVRGPAFGKISNSKSEISSPSDWPTYRGNAARSGSTKSAVPADLKRVWQADLGGKLTALTIAGGKLFVASPETHTVRALDAGTGSPVWSFTAGGRVDSPPTIWRGHALFGSADGHVYCLRASDGALAWRFQAAPAVRQQVAFEQVESVWPVHGNVLVQNDTAWCVAGRSMFIDGGLRLLRLDPRTGRKLGETLLDDQDPELKTNLQVHVDRLNMPVGLPDILSSDGKYVYMRSLPFDLEGRRKFVTYVDVKDQAGDDTHLFSPTGFLDDTLWHRTYWVYGRAFASGAGGYYQAGRIVPAGRIMVADDATVYGYGRRWQYYRWTTPLEFHLFASPKEAEVVKAGEEAKKPKKKAGKKKGTLGKTPFTRFAWKWSDELSVQATAMALADKTLFVAGPPDLVDEEVASRAISDPEIRKKLVEQEAAFEGKRGGLLVAVSAADGKKLAAYRLDSAPNFDGLAAAGGRLYLSTLDGKVICLGAGQGQPLRDAPDVVLTPRSPESVGKVTPPETMKGGGKTGKAGEKEG